MLTAGLFCVDRTFGRTNLANSLNWFRVYHEARNDAKLRSLTDREHRLWFNLLCFASEQASRGVSVYDNLDLLALEISEIDTVTMCNGMKRLVTLRILKSE